MKSIRGIDARVRTRAVLQTAMGLAGVEAIRFASVRHPIGRRSRLIRALSVDHVIHVGANVGKVRLGTPRNGLRGQGARLVEFVAIQLELSLVRLYADAPLADEMDRFVSAGGYQLAGMEPGFADPVSGRLLQMDGIYVRSDVLGELPGGAR